MLGEREAIARVTPSVCRDLMVIIIIIALSPVVTGLGEARVVASPVAFVQSTATSAEMPPSP